MKKIAFFKIIILFTFLVFLVSSCKKDEKAEPITPPVVPHLEPSVLSCKVNGVFFEAASVSIRWVSYGGGVHKIGCKANDADGNSLSFVVRAHTIGHYQASGSSSSTSSLDFSYRPSGSQNFAGFTFQDVGFVNFTQVSNYDEDNMEISGTFEFSVRGGNLPESPYFVTDGIFEYVRW